MADTSDAHNFALGAHAFKIIGSGGANGSPMKLAASFLSLPNANLADMRLAPILDARPGSADDFELPDLLPTRSQRESILHQATIVVAKTLIEHGPFGAYQDEPLLQFRPRRPLPAEYRTRQKPINSVTGVASAELFTSLVRGAYITKLRLDEESFEDRAIPSVNSAAINNAIRRAQASAESSGHHSSPLLSLQLAPGLLDIQRKLAKAILNTHGCPAATSDPGSFTTVFKVINKQDLLAGKPKDYHELMSALHTVLAASVLEMWRKECGHESVAAFAATRPTAQQIFNIAKRIVLKYAKRVVPADPGRFPDDADFSSGASDLDSDDAVYASSRIRTRDLLYIFMLKAAISEADVGRVEDLLGVIAIYMAGAHMDANAADIIKFLRDLKHVWSEAFGNIMRDSMILPLFRASENAMPADVSTPYLSAYSKFYFTANDLGEHWHEPTSMADAIALIDDFDRRMRRPTDQCPIQ
ncbi:hypothetical protein C8J57DRAFT_214205 [Mycena rebaudengoi]|nr:hypothetical protein C8J57DRAFT_214205 [Mycena rebaudengoi]